MRFKRHNEFIKIGLAILENTYRKFNLKFKESFIRENFEILKKFGFHNFDELLLAIGEDRFNSLRLINILFPQKKIHKNFFEIEKKFKLKKFNLEKLPALNIKGLIPGMAVHYAKCCSPLPGENIVGIVTTGKGVTVHTIDCNTLEKFYDIPERWLNIHWDKSKISPLLQLGRGKCL